MKTIKFLLLAFIATSIISCDKDDYDALEKDDFSENYLKATINGEQLLVYENAGLNKDTVPNTFHFSFGRSVTNKTDTCLFISACLNKNNIHISFPMPTESTTYAIYCNSDITGIPSAYYSKVPELTPDNGLETFYTQNILHDENIEGLKLGEIVIDSLDIKNKFIKGHFSFAALGYRDNSESLISSKNLSIILNGEFYYKWNDSLEI